MQVVLSEKRRMRPVGGVGLGLMLRDLKSGGRFRNISSRHGVAGMIVEEIRRPMNKRTVIGQPLDAGGKERRK